ncbi:hypothetical protein N7520_005784 [Penicillium odoratum]|uniref:uncharacterized protein n=1 Tax=Penicillium odoratum TaxID=1167516 RepID=UPI00254930A4|nr:uncharacterized protein N7520_005784 [Penicillium odoratum]KAJ5758628.1 hypothetical protein N7520_005784 [Penicillium odoratum]
MTCGDYLPDFVRVTGRDFLEGTSTNPDVWMNFGIMWIFILFNIFGAVFLYWMFRVPKKMEVHETATIEGDL